MPSSTTLWSRQTMAGGSFERLAPDATGNLYGATFTGGTQALDETTFAASHHPLQDPSPVAHEIFYGR